MVSDSDRSGYRNSEGLSYNAEEYQAMASSLAARLALLVKEGEAAERKELARLKAKYEPAQVTR